MDSLPQKAITAVMAGLVVARALVVAVVQEPLEVMELQQLVAMAVLAHLIA